MRTMMIGVASLMLLGGCDAAATKTVEPSGVRGTRSFDLSGFDQVALQGMDDIVVTVGPQYSVTAVGDQAVLDKLDIRVREDVLRVSREKGWSWGKTGKVQVRVSMPAIEAAVVAGSGNLTVDTVKGEAFKGSIAGSGNLTVGAVAVREAGFGIAGSGNVQATGTAERAEYEIAGSGDIVAGTLAAKALKASIAGSGNIAAAASDTADISIVGSGDVTVRGKPKCDVSKLGSGRVTCGG